MIRFEFDSPDRGADLEFADIAAAIVAAQDEGERWRTELRQAGARIPAADGDDHTAYLAPLQAWKMSVDELNGIRRRRTEGDHVIDSYGLAVVSSPAAGALLWTLKWLGPIAAHYAAVAAGLDSGEIDWNNDAAFKGVIGFERVLRIRADIADGERRKPMEGTLEVLTGRAEALGEQVKTFSEQISEKIAAADIQVLTDRREMVENWRKLKGQADELRDRVEATIATATTLLGDTTAESTRAVQAWLNDARDSIAHHSESSTATLKRATDEGATTIQNWITANIEQRQLAKPARLWASRAKIHQRRASALRWWAVGVGFVGLLLSAGVADGAFHLSGALFADAIVPGAAKAVAGTLKPTFHYQLVSTGVVTLAWLTMYLWAMRVLVRLYTTEHHLQIDASARGAMNDTYIGLVAAGAANEKDRPIVLAALFRPVQDGIVSDDGPPGFAPATLVSGIVSGGKTG